MTDYAILLFFILLFPCLLGLGIYLSFHKRKLTGGAQPTDWLDKLNLSPSAKGVRLKEINKQTEKAFTRRWFLEYWQGERTAFSAWFTWLFLGGIIIQLLWMLFLSSTPGALTLIGILIIIFIYKILASVIMWKCAKNSTPGNKYYARFVAVAGPLAAIMSLFR